MERPHFSSFLLTVSKIEFLIHHLNRQPDFEAFVLLVFAECQESERIIATGV